MNTDIKIRIGSVPYLNADPLTYGLEDHPDVSLSHNVPSELMNRLLSGELDCAFAPTFDALRHPELRVLEGPCVSCYGPVASVLLLAKKPVAELESVGLDFSSSSSAHLIQVLLAELHGCHPVFERVPPDAGKALETHDAVLLIGDPALTAIDRGLGPDTHAHDLGSMWRELTGLPFVFAVFVLGPHADEYRISELLQASKKLGLANRGHLAKRAALELQLPEATLSQYLHEHIRYDLGPKEVLGIQTYRALLAKLGLLGPKQASQDLVFSG